MLISFKEFLNLSEMANTHDNSLGLLAFEFYKDFFGKSYKMILYAHGKEKTFEIEDLFADESKQFIVNTIFKIFVKKGIIKGIKHEDSVPMEEKKKLIMDVVKENFEDRTYPYDVIVKNGTAEIHKEISPDILVKQERKRKPNHSWLHYVV